jgi:4-methylaminobutanoate oxidase (formaldehyde-forming)
MAGTYELEVATERVPAAVTLRPLHDPTNTRVKG